MLVIKMQDALGSMVRFFGNWLLFFFFWGFGF